MTAVVNRKSRFFIVLLARLTNFPPWYAVTLTVGNRTVRPRFRSADRPVGGPSQWLPTNPDYKIAAGINVELYSDASKFENGTQDQDYYCEIWIPVEKK